MSEDAKPQTELVGSARTRFKKGQTGNPRGCSQRVREAQSVRKVGRETLNRISHALFVGDIPGLQALAQDKTLTPIEKLCISVVLKAVEKGDAQAMTLLMDRFLGKATERVDVRAVHADINDLKDIDDGDILRRRELLLNAGKE